MKYKHFKQALLFKVGSVLYKAFAPSGRRAKCDDTQGDALGYEFLPLQGVGACRKGAAEIYTTPGAASILLLSILLSA